MERSKGVIVERVYSSTKVLLSALIAISLYSLPASSQSDDGVMSPTEIFTRCYMQLSGMVPDSNSALYKSVEARSIAPAEACAQIFDKAKFAASGVLATPSDEVSRSVLERMHLMHISWFSNKFYVGGGGTGMFQDYEEQALYFTRSAFFPGGKFSDAVTLNMGLTGVRRPTLPAGATIPQLMEAQNLEVRRSSRFNGKYVDPVPFPTDVYTLAVDTFINGVPIAKNRIFGSRPLNQSQVTEFGKIIGVKARPVFTINNFYDPILAARLPQIREAVVASLASAKVNEHFGGGLLGSQSYILNNSNLSINNFPDGENTIHRRLGLRVYEDLMCHQLPTLLPADVQSEVIPSSSHTFRQTNSCMRCHSSMDPAAYHFGNLFKGRTSAITLDPMGYVPDYVKKVPVVNHPEVFSSQTPKGRIMYRTLVANKLVKVNTGNITNLGNHIAASDDYYLCAAKRYYKHFTGVDVQLVSKETEAKELYHQNQVVTLSKKLKTTQSVRETLKTLFASPAYVSRDFKAREVSSEP